ncbi:hypothetical protein diail_2361 [Diaporthe ilicicola]|nr:hypothetical protein diail_2361 [Diaporthe ilicicola]
MTDHAGISEAVPLPPILQLTPQLRHQIYLHLNLVNELVGPNGACPPRLLDLNGHNVYGGVLGFYGLLLSCRTLYDEASALLYSRNRFVIHYSDEGSLQPLRDLTDIALSHLTSLKVVLYEASCHSKAQHEAWGYGHCCFDLNNELLYDFESGTWDCHLDHSTHGSHGLGIHGQSPSTSKMLTEWKLTAEHLSSRINPTKLNMAMVCDVLNRQDAPTAQLAVAPLLLLAPLKDCHVRLSRRTIPHLQHKAQRAVLQARGISRVDVEPTLIMPPKKSDPPASPFLSLPRELRFRILEYTDLITPWKEVTWSRQHRGYIASYTQCSNSGMRGVECPSAIHQGCQFRKCFDAYPHASMGCFCRVRHGAFSSTCKCWAPPTDLFLICRTLYEDAQAVFFSGNRFVVHDIQTNPPWYAPAGEYSSETFGASEFLREVVPTSCLSQLRFLEFVFPPLSHDSWPRDEHPAIQDWADTIEWLRPLINAPGLTIRLVMADASEWSPPEDREDMTKAQGDAVLTAYARILGPLARLGDDHLGRFHAQFAWPWSWTPRAQDRLRHNLEEGLSWLRAKEAVLNERAERLVMGKRYEWLRRENGQPPTSVWQSRFARDA